MAGLSLLALSSCALVCSVAAVPSGRRALRSELHIFGNASWARPDSFASCIRDTGAVCGLDGCESWRGQTTCHDSCVCDSGLCSTAGGRCVAQTNQLVAQTVVLKNARYTDSVLAIRESSALSAYPTTDKLDENRLLTLFKLPVAQGEQDIAGYVLASRDGHLAMRCVATEQKGGCAPQAESMPYADMKQVGLRLQVAPPYEGRPSGVQSLVIEHADTGSYIFMNGFGFLGGSEEHEGVAAYWIPAEPLPGISEPYHGPPCEWDCGKFGSGREDSARFYVMLSYVSIAFCLLFCAVAAIGAALSGAWGKH